MNPGSYIRNVVIVVVGSASAVSCGAGRSAAAAGYQTQRPAPETDLNERLIKYYPPAERLAGQEGSAIVRLTVLRSGRIANLALVKSSAPDFGKSCVDMLTETRWRPALNRYGGKADASITFVCSYEVGDPSQRRSQAGRTLKSEGRLALDECVRAQPGGSQPSRSAGQARSLRLHFDTSGRVATVQISRGVPSDPITKCLASHARTWMSPMHSGREMDIIVDIP
jgi:TonB family protein